MRKLRDNIIRVLTSLDMFLSAALLIAYVLTGLALLMLFYYITNLALLVMVVIYFFDLSDKRSNIERTRSHICEVEEEDK